jgi:hypothetical protein
MDIFSRIDMRLESQQHYPTFAGSWSNAVKGSSRSSANQRTKFGETEVQAQKDDQLPVKKPSRFAKKLHRKLSKI